MLASSSSPAAWRRQLGSNLLIHTAFCYVQVIEGLDVVTKIENSPTGRMDRPQQTVMIKDCGEL